MKRFEHGGNIYRFKAQAEARGIQMTIRDFSANINCLGPSERVKAAFESSFINMGAYPDPHYTAFIEAVAEKYQLLRENVFPGNGAAELLHMAVAAIEPKTALVVGPTFVEYERALEAYDCQTTFFMNEDQEDFKPDLEKLKACITEDQPDLVILCNPNNPTGVLVERPELMQLVELCEHFKIHLILDEAFMDFAAERATMMSQVEEQPHLMILRSLTKFHAIPAIRAGFMVTASPIFKNHFERKAIPWSMNQAAQEVAVAAISDIQFEEATLKYYKEESKRFFDDLSTLPGFKVFWSEANYLFFRYDGKHDLEPLLNKSGVLIRSCRNYRGLDARYYRVAVKARSDNDFLMMQLREILENDNH